MDSAKKKIRKVAAKVAGHNMKYLCKTMWQLSDWNKTFAMFGSTTLQPLIL